MSITLQYHNSLNPAIWNGFKLNNDIKKMLLSFADRFREFCKIPESAVKDILFVGGNANYLYNNMSDLDVHVVVDKDEISQDRELLDDYLKSKKLLWALQHQNLRIRGYQLEGYIQGLDEISPPGQGVYSLMNSRWLQKPLPTADDFLQDTNINKKVVEYMEMIDSALMSRSDISVVEELKKKLFDSRKESLNSYGEYGLDNLVFKELRNMGYIQKINNYLINVPDEEFF